jgi:hypothetical protein
MLFQIVTNTTVGVRRPSSSIPNKQFDPRNQFKMESYPSGDDDRTSDACDDDDQTNDSGDDDDRTSDDSEELVFLPHDFEDDDRTIDSSDDDVSASDSSDDNDDGSLSDSSYLVEEGSYWDIASPGGARSLIAAAREGKKPKDNQVYITTESWKDDSLRDLVCEFLREFSIHSPGIPLNLDICGELRGGDEENNLRLALEIQEIWRECESSYPHFSKSLEFEFGQFDDKVDDSWLAACLDQITIPFRRLEVKFCRLNDATESLANSITRHTHLEEVEFGHFNIQADPTPVAAAVATLPNLKKISFDFEGCDHPALAGAAVAIAQSKSVEDLSIINYPASEDLRELIQSLKILPKLRTLRLEPMRGTLWSNLQVLRIAQLLKNNLSLEDFTLDFFQKVEDNVSAMPLMTALRTNNKLHTLSLDGGASSNSELEALVAPFQALVDILGSHNYALEEVKLRNLSFLQSFDSNHLNLMFVELWGDERLNPALHETTRKKLNEIDFWLKLNKNSQRKRLLSRTSNSSHEDWVNVIAEHNKDVSAIYYYLSNNISLMCPKAAAASPELVVHEEAKRPAGLDDEPPRKRRRVGV